jgi:hypothetical protein
MGFAFGSTHPTIVFARHSREGGTSAQRAGRPQAGPEGTSEASNPWTLMFNGLTSMDPRLRGDDGVEILCIPVSESRF